MRSAGPEFRQVGDLQMSGDSVGDFRDTALVQRAGVGGAVEDGMCGDWRSQLPKLSLMSRIARRHRSPFSNVLVAIVTFVCGFGGPLSFGHAQVGPAGTPPRAVTVAKAVAIPACTVFVEASATGGGTGTVQQPHKTIGAAVAAAEPGAIICVTDGRRSSPRPGLEACSAAV